jgi:hypothetical protein
MTQNQTKTGPIPSRCPHLGLLNDPGSAFAYPNPANYCFHCQKPRAPRPDQQSAFCLTSDEPDCPVFVQAPNQPFPAALAWLEPGPRRRRWPLWAWGLVMGGLLLAGGLFWWAAQPVGLAAQPANLVSATPSLPSATPSLRPPKVGVTSPPPTASPLPPTLTVTPTPTLTLLPPQVHTLDEPVTVNGQRFVLHRVAEGEQFALLLKHYETNAEVVTAINYLPPAPVWVGRVLVLAPGLQAVPAILPLDPYQVTEAARLEDLAASLRADPQLMLTYNSCNPGCELVPGDWVMVPRPWPTPTP